MSEAHLFLDSIPSLKTGSTKKRDGVTFLSETHEDTPVVPRDTLEPVSEDQGDLFRPPSPE